MSSSCHFSSITLLSSLSSPVLDFFFHFLDFWSSGVAIDSAGNAFAVGTSGGVQYKTVFYSPLSSGYTKWTPIPNPCKLCVKPIDFPIQSKILTPWPLIICSSLFAANSDINAITCLTGTTASAVIVGDSGNYFDYCL